LLIAPLIRNSELGYWKHAQLSQCDYVCPYGAGSLDGNGQSVASRRRHRARPLLQSGSHCRRWQWQRRADIPWKKYPFEVSGASFGATLELSVSEFVGRALNLRSPGDLAGSYTAVGAGGALVGGLGGVRLRKADGVVLVLSGPKLGVALSANLIRMPVDAPRLGFPLEYRRRCLAGRVLALRRGQDLFHDDFGDAARQLVQHEHLQIDGTDLSRH
jgi:hypothetical protein